MNIRFTDYGAGGNVAAARATPMGRQKAPVAGFGSPGDGSALRRREAARHGQPTGDQHERHPQHQAPAVPTAPTSTGLSGHRCRQAPTRSSRHDRSCFRSRVLHRASSAEAGEAKIYEGVYTFPAGITLSSGDIIQMVKIPLNHVITNAALTISATLVRRAPHWSASPMPPVRTPRLR